MEWAFLTLTLYGEARGADEHGMQAVANVIMNRLHERRWGKSVSEVVTASRINDSGRRIFQFSCWQDANKEQMIQMFANDQTYMALLAKDPEAAVVFKAQMEKDPNWHAFQKAKKVALNALRGDLRDITNGANHYHTTAVNPYWSPKMRPTVSKPIGNHLFFTDRS